jgi:hypothetical protein
MAKFVPGNLGGSMQRAGAAISGMGQTIYDVEAEEQFRTGQRALVSTIEKFKTDLLTDPDYGTPGEGDGYVGKFNKFMEGSGDMPGAVGEALGKTVNQTARQRLSEYASQLMSSQGAEIQELQTKRWMGGIDAKEDQGLAEIAGKVPIDKYFKRLDDSLAFRSGYNILDENQRYQKAVVYGQLGYKSDMKKAALAAMDSAADPLDGYAAALDAINSYSGDKIVNGKPLAVGEETRQAIATDVKAEYAMRQAVLEKRSEEYLSDYQTQLDTDPETIITDISAEVEKIQTQPITKAAKDKATMALWDHNAEAIEASAWGVIGSATKPKQLTDLLTQLQATEDLWQGNKYKQRRIVLEDKIRNYLAEMQRADGGDKDALTAQFASRMLFAWDGVSRNDMPSEELRRGAAMNIRNILKEATEAGVNMESTALKYLEKLGAITSTDSSSLKAYDAMYMKLIGKTKDSDLTAQQIQEKNTLLNAVTAMREAGTMKSNEIDAYVSGALLDITKDTFKILREDKFGKSPLTTDTKLKALGLLQSGQLANQMPLAAGRRMTNPTIDATVKVLEEYMGGELAKQGFTDIDPKQQPDGSYEFAAKRPGLAQPYRLKPQIDEATGKMGFQEYIPSRKAWEPWKDPKTGKPVLVTPQAEAPMAADLEEIKKIVAGSPKNAQTLAEQLINAVVQGRISYSSVISAGPALGELSNYVLDRLPGEYKKRTAK